MALYILFIVYSLLPLIVGIATLVRNKNARIVVTKYLLTYVLLQAGSIFTYGITAAQSFAACAGGCSDENSFGLTHNILIYGSVVLALVTPGVVLYLISNMHKVNHNKSLNPDAQNSRAR